MNRMSDATEFTAADFAPAALSKISGKMSPREMLKCGLIAPLTTAGKRYAVVVVQAIEPTVEALVDPTRSISPSVFACVSGTASTRPAVTAYTLGGVRCGRTEITTEELPVELLWRGFRTFMDEMGSIQPSETQMQQCLELCVCMAMSYDDEADRQDKFNLLFGALWGQEVVPTGAETGCTTKTGAPIYETNDGAIVIHSVAGNPFYPLIQETRNEIGTTDMDPVAEGLQAFRVFEKNGRAGKKHTYLQHYTHATLRCIHIWLM
jgi:hypothetical protein